MLVVITSPTATPEEMSYYAGLFEVGLHDLHLRLPGYSRALYEEAILAIPHRYRERVVICDYPELADKYGLGGIHLRRDSRDEYPKWRGRGLRISVSAHSIEELETLPFVPTYALLSPVYDSISKEGYKAAIDLDECRRRLPVLPFPVLGLGGVTPVRMAELQSRGLGGGAVLGYISEAGQWMKERFRTFPAPEVLSVAGHDPSSGAGLVADARTIQGLDAHPLTVTSALTVQDESAFDQVMPLSDDAVLEPLSFLLSRGHVPLAAKIGLVSSLGLALSIARLLKQYGVRYLIWDPVLGASAAREDGQLYSLTQEQLREMLALTTLVTPNRPEALRLFGTDDPAQLHELSRQSGCAILLKGGHGDDALRSTDLLLRPDTTEPIASVVPRTPWDKHGTGCMLSASIATRLAQGYTLEQACRQAQWGVDEYRRSATGLIGDMNFSLLKMKDERIRRSTLQFITNSSDEGELLSSCRAVLEGGVRWIQLRMKQSTHADRVRMAIALKALMKEYAGATLIIDDDIDAVIESDADGVHLGLMDESPVEARRRLGMGKIIGGTCNTAGHLRQRALEGVDYVGVGPYRHTTTKANLSPILGYQGLQQIVTANRQLAHSLPIIAIGGIVEDDLRTLSPLGIKGVALSGVLLHAENIQATAQQIQEACNRYFLE